VMAVANNEPNNLETLENQLRELSHDDRVFTIIQDFAYRLGKTKDRQKVFGYEFAASAPHIGDFRESAMSDLCSPVNFMLLQ